MDPIEKILWWIKEGIKNVRSHRTDKRNTELILAYYDGYEAALKEIKKKVTKIKEEEAECQIN